MQHSHGVVIVSVFQSFRDTKNPRHGLGALKLAGCAVLTCHHVHIRRVLGPERDFGKMQDVTHQLG